MMFNCARLAVLIADILNKFGADWHKGMLHVQDVPGFEYILIHTGNTDEHTMGCLLVADTSQQNITKDGFIGASVDAYKRIYPSLAQWLVDGNKLSRLLILITTIPATNLN